MLAKKLESAAKAVESAYIEDVFSTYLYTGNGSTQTITNNIDLSTKGGLVWLKSRSVIGNNWTQDTDRGVNSVLYPNLTNAAGNPAGTAVSAFNTTGFSLGSNTNINNTGDTYASWTFRKQPKFFDIVTYTGDGTSSKTISHNLGSTPGCIIVKNLTTAQDWLVYHTSLGNTQALFLDLTSAAATSSAYWNNTSPTSTNFTVGSSSRVNESGSSFVAYLFAHNAGGFGLTGLDNVISCGSFTTDGSGNATVNLGYEPQWVMIKKTSAVGSWAMLDTMRGYVDGPTDSYLYADSSGAESTFQFGNPTSTGFYLTGFGDPSSTYIYIAIRRGPMKVPTTGTSVFAPVTYTGDGTTPRTITTGIKTDLIIGGDRDTGFGPGNTDDRLRGQANLVTSDTGAEAVSTTSYPKFDVMNGYTNLATGGSWNSTSTLYIRWAFQRAPSFFDEVCYTGNGTAGTTITHNLGVAPELMIIKSRSSAGTNWGVGLPSLTNREIYLNLAGSYGSGNTTVSTASTFTLQGMGGTANINASGSTYVAYLFATCAGVSKVGSYTGNGSSQTINCGFTGGARFVLIKRTDSTGDWYVWDTARGIVSGNDPHLSLNTTVAEVTTDDTIDPDSTGFIVNQLSATNVNVSSATYIYLAIA